MKYLTEANIKKAAYISGSSVFGYCLNIDTELAPEFDVLEYTPFSNFKAAQAIANAIRQFLTEKQEKCK